MGLIEAHELPVFSGSQRENENIFRRAENFFSLYGDNACVIVIINQNKYVVSIASPGIFFLRERAAKLKFFGRIRELKEKYAKPN